MTARGIPALTLTNPWAHAITHHDKRVENRPWLPPGAVHHFWLHAGRSWDEAGLFRLGRLGCQHEAITSAIVALVSIPGICVAGPKGYTCGCGAWAVTGLYHWSLQVVRVLKEPVPCRGYQGFWYPSPELAEQLTT